MLRDRRIWLGVATVVVLVLAWRVLMPASTPEATTAPAARARGNARASADAQPLVVRPVKLDALTASREEPNSTQRNPFRFQPKDVPAPPRPVVTTPTAEVAKPAEPPVAAGPPPPPQISLKFIGVVERANGVKWAVLSDGKSAPQHGKEGDVIEGRYRILKIGTESIELSYLDGRGRQTVRLSGQ